MSILRANVLPASAARTINEKLMAAGYQQLIEW